MEEKMKKISEENTTHKEKQKYIGSFLFFMHLCLACGMIWLGIMIPAPAIWFGIMGYGVIFLLSATMHKNGDTGKAVLLTIGSLFLGVFLLFAACVTLLSSIH